MKTELWKRLARVEQAAQHDDGGFEVWVGTGEDELLGPNGEIISREEFERRYSDAIPLSGPLGAPYERG